MSDSESDDENGVDLHRVDDTVIRNVTIVYEGRVFEAKDNNEATTIQLADTTVAAQDDRLYRCVGVSTGENIYYQEITAKEEEAIVTEAAKALGSAKPSFTRWYTMVKRGEYPAKASADEKAIFGKCMMSHTAMAARQQAKRDRDAESRRRRANGKRPRTEPTPEPEVIEPEPETGGAAIEMSFKGTPAEVIAALKCFAG